MATPELFTVTFWEVTAAQVVHAAAAGAVSVVAANAFGLIGSVPWYGVLSAAGLAAITTLLLALAGKVNPATGPATLFVPPPAAVKLATTRHPAVKAAKAAPRPRKPRS